MSPLLDTPGEARPRFARTIRVVAHAVIRHDSRVLVQEGYDPASQRCAFHRLPGGEVGFGELGADALRRELLEELGLETEVGERLAVIENVFTWDGRRGHELVLVHEARFVEEHAYHRSAFAGTGTWGEPLNFVWRDIDGQGEHVPLVPAALDHVLATRDHHHGH